VKIAVMGAGAVGCYYGGMLARAGHAVTLIGRALHVEAIRSGGLRLETQALDARVPLAASSAPAAVAGARLVLCCMKSTDSEAAESAALAALFAAAGVPARVADDVLGELWAKLILNCAYNALSAITQLPYGVLKRRAGVDAVMRDVVGECLAVARASGVVVPGDAWEAVERIARTLPRQLSSTAQDLARGKRSEIDHLNGSVAREGERLGVATPVNRVLHTLVKGIEARVTAATPGGDRSRASY
jgi:ketopantoate reductase